MPANPTNNNDLNIKNSQALQAAKQKSVADQKVANTKFKNLVAQKNVSDSDKEAQKASKNKNASQAMKDTLAKKTLEHARGKGVAPKQVKPQESKQAQAAKTAKPVNQQQATKKSKKSNKSDKSENSKGTGKTEEEAQNSKTAQHQRVESKQDQNQKQDQQDAAQSNFLGNAMQVGQANIAPAISATAPIQGAAATQEAVNQIESMMKTNAATAVEKSRDADGLLRAATTLQQGPLKGSTISVKYNADGKPKSLNMKLSKENRRLIEENKSDLMSRLSDKGLNFEEIEIESTT